MRLIDTRIIESPDDPQRARLVADITLAASPDTVQQLYLDVPGEYADRLTTDSTPWLPPLVFIAAHRGEPLRLDKPVDRMLYENVHEQMRIWYRWGWTPKLLIPIETDFRDPDPSPPAARTMLFFTAGVDSLFSLLSDNAEVHPERDWRITDLLSIWGYDVPLDRPALYRDVLARKRRVADAVGKPLLDVHTNLRAFLSLENWVRSHGSGLAAIALAFESVWGRALIAAGLDDYGQSVSTRMGMHPLIIPRWSSSRMALQPEGLHYTRQAKVGYLVDQPLAYDSLRVCFNLEHADNCNRCGKCLRTMLQLDIADALDRFTAFQPDGYRDLIPQMSAKRFGAMFAGDMRAEAERRGKHDIVRLLDRMNRRWYGPRRREVLEAFLRRWVMPARAARLVGQAADAGYVLVRKRQPRFGKSES